MTVQTPLKLASDATAVQPPTRVNGVFDLPAPNRVAGWAIDRADPEAAVEVELLRDGVVVARVRADRHRPDLEKGGIGTGRYGFSVTLDEALPPEMIFTLSARAITADGTTGALRPTGEAVAPDDPMMRLLERTYRQTRTLASELELLRQSVAASVAAAGSPAAEETAAVLERIELVQARLDGATAPAPLPADPALSPGLRWTIWGALGLSALAVALGLWSLFA